MNPARENFLHPVFLSLSVCRLVSFLLPLLPPCALASSACSSLTPRRPLLRLHRSRRLEPLLHLHRHPLFTPEYLSFEKSKLWQRERKARIKQEKDGDDKHRSRNKNVAYASKRDTSGEETNFPIRPPELFWNTSAMMPSPERKKCAAGKTHRRNLGAHCAKKCNAKKKNKSGSMKNPTPKSVSNTRYRNVPTTPDFPPRRKYKEKRKKRYTRRQRRYVSFLRSIFRSYFFSSVGRPPHRRDFFLFRAILYDYTTKSDFGMSGHSRHSFSFVDWCRVCIIAFSCGVYIMDTKGREFLVKN